MKTVIALIMSLGFLVWADDYNGDPNMEFGMNSGKATEGTFNDKTKAHQLSQQYFGTPDTAYCPNCAKQNALHERPDDGDPASINAGTEADAASSDSDSQQ